MEIIGATRYLWTVFWAYNLAFVDTIFSVESRKLWPNIQKCFLHFMFFYLVIACGNHVCFQPNRLKVIENELMQASTKKFSLEKFYKEPSVSSIQMVDCCKRLLEQSLPYLQGMHLCISHFYSVMQDGDLCIPWNWKNGEAIK